MSLRKVAASAGYYHSPGWDKASPRIQLLTVAELLGGKRIDYPQQANVMHKRATRVEVNTAVPLPLPRL